MKRGEFSIFKSRALNAALASTLALAGTGLVGNAYANTTTITATSSGGSVAVITPIAITAPVVLSFGKFARGAGGSVTISTSGARTGSGVILVSTSSTQTAARFDVTGEASTAYIITHSGVTALTGISGAAATGPQTMALAKTSDLTAGNATSGNVSSGSLSSGGAQSIFVGGTLTVGASQAAGVYTGAVTVTVEYN